MRRYPRGMLSDLAPPPSPPARQPVRSSASALVVSSIALLLAILALLVAVLDGACRPDPVPAGAPATTDTFPIEKKAAP